MQFIRLKMSLLPFSIFHVINFNEWKETNKCDSRKNILRFPHFQQPSLQNEIQQVWLVVRWNRKLKKKITVILNLMQQKHHVTTKKHKRSSCSLLSIQNMMGGGRPAGGRHGNTKDTPSCTTIGLIFSFDHRGDPISVGRIARSNHNLA